MNQIAVSNLRIRGISSDAVTHFRQQGRDANSQAPIELVSDGISNPCRHCLGLISKGDVMLLLAYRPFDELQPYAETGPIFLHKEGCLQSSSATSRQRSGSSLRATATVSSSRRLTRGWVDQERRSSATERVFA